MISIVMSPEQFTEAKIELARTEGVILTPGELAGSIHIHSPQIDADVFFDGAELTLSNIKKHGLAKFASDDTIESHLIDMIGALKCSATQAPAPNSTDAKS